MKKYKYPDYRYENLKECTHCGTLKESEPTPEGDEICPSCGDREMMDFEKEFDYSKEEAEINGGANREIIKKPKYKIDEVVRHVLGEELLIVEVIETDKNWDKDLDILYGCNRKNFTYVKVRERYLKLKQYNPNRLD
jgi:hypothetical protein